MVKKQGGSLRLFSQKEEFEKVGIQIFKNLMLERMMAILEKIL
jgi:hypothetical protein